VSFARFRWRNLVVFLLLALWILVCALGQQLGFEIPIGVVVAVTVLIVMGNLVLLSFLLVREVRRDVRRVLAAHEGAVAFPSTVTASPGADRAERQGVIVVVGDERGLSFRDQNDREVFLVPADRIMSLELAPLEPRARFRPLRVKTIDGATIDFAGPSNPDEQVDAVVALRAAIATP
jgi:hypothetical protein